MQSGPTPTTAQRGSPGHAALPPHLQLSAAAAAEDAAEGPATPTTGQTAPLPGMQASADEVLPCGSVPGSPPSSAGSLSLDHLQQQLVQNQGRGGAVGPSGLEMPRPLYTNPKSRSSPFASSGGPPGGLTSLPMTRDIILQVSLGGLTSITEGSALQSGPAACLPCPWVGPTRTGWLLRSTSRQGKLKQLCAAQAGRRQRPGGAPASMGAALLFLETSSRPACRQLARVTWTQPSAGSWEWGATAQTSWGSRTSAA